MSMRNYGIYQQGAIFFHEDFDPIKVITAILKNDMITPPDDIKAALESNTFSKETGTVLCEMMDIEYINPEDITGFAYISNALISEAEYEMWFDEKNPLMGSDGVSVYIYGDFEGEYVFDCDDKEDMLVENCFIFSLDFPLVWKSDDFKGPRTKSDVLKHIKETAAALLKNDIDWEKRLGYLIGSIFA